VRFAGLVCAFGPLFAVVVSFGGQAVAKRFLAFGSRTQTGMRGNVDPRELQRLSVEARRRNRLEQMDIATRLEAAGLDLLADPSTPHYIRERVIARLSRSSSTDQDTDIGTSEDRGVPVGSLLANEPTRPGDPARSVFDEADAGAGTGDSSELPSSVDETRSVERSEGFQGTPIPSEISDAFDPKKWMARGAWRQNVWERSRPDPNVRPRESFRWPWDGDE
jgi:hypothetical protein